MDLDWSRPNILQPEQAQTRLDQVLARTTIAH